ncbi:hypothetical protein AB0J36_11985, partial [Micromonospora sp. NPDC049662]
DPISPPVPGATAPGATGAGAPAPVAAEQGTPRTASFEPTGYEPPAPTMFESMPDPAPTAELRTPEPPTAELRTPEPPTAELSTAEPPTAELSTADAATAGMVHPAWLAHAPAEPETSPATAQAAEPTRVDHPLTPVGETRAADPSAEKSADTSAETSAGDKDPAASDGPATGDDPAGADERAGRREDS